MSTQANSVSYWESLISAGLKMPTTLETLRTPQSSGATTAESHSLKAEEIDAIRRLQSRGYRVIDLDPNLLDRAEFASPYSSDILANITGENLTTSDIDGSGTSKCANPYWRTFTFDCPGNSIKIEFLPVRQEMGRGIATTPLEQPISLTPENTTQTMNPSFIAEASRRIVLLDFEAPTASPHVVNDGSVFKTYFSAFLLTVKNFNTRIRITIGYNSEIQTPDDKETSLSLFGGRGITSRHQLAPTPFSVSHNDFSTSSSYGFLMPTPYTTQRDVLFYNPDIGSPVGTPIGGCVLWLTSMAAGLACPAGSSADGLMQYDLVLYEMNAIFAPTTQLKRIISLDAYLQNGNQFSEGQQITFTEPIRVSIPPLTCVVLRRTLVSSPSGVNGVFSRFNINGYVLGGFAANEVSGLSVAPYQLTTFVKENPWPMDYAFDGIPQR